MVSQQLQPQIKIQQQMLSQYIKIPNLLHQSSQITKSLKQQFCKAQKKTTPTPIPTVPSSTPVSTQSSLSMFHEKLQRFVDKFDTYLSAAKNSPYNYLALFGRACLIASSCATVGEGRGKLEQDRFYGVLKAGLNGDNHQLTPLSSSILIQCLSNLKFEGDETKIIQKLCNYYQTNGHRFNWIEETVFWESYVKIMSEKAHASVKFVDIHRRKSQETLEFVQTKKLVETCIGAIKGGMSKYISQLHFPHPDQISLVLTPPLSSSSTKSSPIPLLIHIKALSNPNNFHQINFQSDELSLQYYNNIIKDIKYVKDSLRKGWDLVIVGNLEKWEVQTKYRYTDKAQDGTDLGFIKSERIFDGEGEEGVDLNDRQCLDRLVVSSRYHKGIFYTSNNPKTRKIDMSTTLMLGSLPSPKIPHFHRLSQNMTNMLTYSPLPFLIQAYGYTSLCKQLHQLISSYMSLQTILHQIQNKQIQEEYDLEIIDRLIHQKNISKQQAKQLLRQNPQIMAKMAVDGVRGINGVWLEGELGRQIQVHDFGWQFKPYFPDLLTILDDAVNRIQNREDGQEKGKMGKLRIIVEREVLGFFVDCLFEGKNWGVPELKPKNKEQYNKRQKLLEEIFSKVNSNSTTVKK